MTHVTEWKLYEMFCPNCAAKVMGHKNAHGQVKMSCRRCGAHLIRTFKGRRHHCIDIYAPKPDDCN